MTLVIDASVALKWMLQEEGTDRAIAIRSESELVAPALILAEVGNALWKTVRRGEAPLFEAQAALNALPRFFFRLVESAELSARALDLAVAVDHPIYDCYYLALAERERAPLMTADNRLLTASRRLKGIEVRLL
jgi:predicted nucleic acid-binding protein